MTCFVPSFAQNECMFTACTQIAISLINIMCVEYQITDIHTKIGSTSEWLYFAPWKYCWFRFWKHF